jgi:AAA domain
VDASLLIGAQALAAAQTHSASWLWHGYLARGAMTLLTSQWKTGKTTLVSVLAARMKSGGSLAGHAVAAGKALIVTEEQPSHWLRRQEKLEFGEHVAWLCRPFAARPSRDEWTAFVDRLSAIQTAFPYSLLVLDPVASLVAGNENNAASMLDCLLPLRPLIERGTSILALHHPSKTDRGLGQSARGSGALPGFADILIEMRFCRKKAADRRRRLTAFSRFPDTPRNLVIEWTADGTDYLALDESWQSAFAANWQSLHAVLANAPRKLNRDDVRECWPDDTVPSKMTVKRWLEKAVAEGHLRKDGHGLASHPFRYWLPKREEDWRRDPECLLTMPELMECLPRNKRK